ncbi:MAG: DUF1080 domain-containing protein [Opitutae bacterium]|nr:DUF1080 domain-containing protein [Opitutae bacterium]
MNPVTMKRSYLLLALLSAVTSVFAAGDAKPYLGHWALTLPNGAAGWLGVTEKDGALQASILWGGGSVVPVTSTKLDGDKLVLTRVRPSAKKAAPGQPAPAPSVETIVAAVSGEALQLATSTTSGEGKVGPKADFKGQRLPPLPAAPDLKKVKYGEPVALFNGKDLTGWKLLVPTAANGWSVEAGVLVNRPVQEEGKPHKKYGNIRSEREFEDFNLTLETRPTKGSNSGVYLRGIYEVQVADSHGKPLDPHNMGAIYSRIRPAMTAEKPAGEWQTLDITLVDRHVTVILNGQKIIDNQPLLGCTGGALWSDVTRPGPIYLQGDHTQIEYRNIVLRSVVK